jgi:fructose-1,6-bisphosphatase/sedoheptulose 1,7-bisphosphatase-like protein
MISKQTFEFALTKMAAPIPQRLNLKQAYAAGVRVGGPLGGFISGAINLGARRPAWTLLGIGGAATAVMAANKLRGVFTMANETNKRRIMNYQSDVMRNIAYNTGRSQEPVQQQQQPMLYPMR